MTTATVKDENGTVLGNVKIGDTKLQALERLSVVGKAGLFDKDNLGLLDSDRITLEGSPYVLNSSKTARITFDVSKLVSSPLDAKIPVIDENVHPTFVCNDDWWTCLAEIEVQLESEDDGTSRVPPMALVRCSRGGKTRALREIAQKMRSKDIAVLFVSFNDQTSLKYSEQDDPLQALLRRIAFSAMRELSLEMTFDDFFSSNRGSYYDPDTFKQWFGNGSVILIVDELNNLDAITEQTTLGRRAAAEFGDFVKSNFLAKTGRYMVYSSHVLSTASAFGEFLDPSKASDRHIVFQQIPLVEDMTIALRDLNNQLHGVREAIYYGLMPGIIYEKGQHRPIVGKREKAVNNFVSQFVKDEHEEFRRLNDSLVSGKLSALSPSLHILVDGWYDEAGVYGIRWLPFHLEYVMDTISRISKSQYVRGLAAVMKTLCTQLHQSKEHSGDGWESLFVLFLMAKCIAREADSKLLPEEWFRNSNTSPRVKYNPYYQAGRSLDQCKNWSELKSGIEASDEPTISIFYPTHAQFQAYDVIAVYSKQGAFSSIYGYQLKEGKANPDQPVEACFEMSFVIKGDPPVSTSQRGEWLIPDSGTINDFFGITGKYWTPQEWKRLSSTLTPDGRV